MRRISINLIMIVLGLGSACFAADMAALRAGMDLMDEINYSVGYQVGSDFKEQKVEMRQDSFIKGIEDAIKVNRPLLTKGEMKMRLLELKRQIVNQQNAERARQHQQGQEFLAENALKEGVVTLESGLQYRILKAGQGKTPTLSDTVKVHYRGSKIDGHEFSSSYRNNTPNEIAVERMIPGLQEALTMMKEGDEWEVAIPSKLAFDEKTPLADQVVVFEVALLEIMPRTESAAQK